MNILNPFYTIGCIFGVNPYYNFRTQVVKTFKSYGCVLIVLSLISLIFGIYESLPRHVNYPVVTNILDIIGQCLLYVQTISMITKATLFGGKSWIKINKNLQFIDKVLPPPKNHRFLQKIHYIFILRFIIFLVCNFYVTLVCYSVAPKIVQSKSFIGAEFCYSYEFFMCFLIIALTSAFKERFKRLNMKLLNKQHKIQIKEIANYWRILGEGVYCFNKIFGWPLLFLIGRAILQLLMSLEFTLLAFEKDFTIKNDFLKRLVITNIVLFSYMIVSNDKKTKIHNILIFFQYSVTTVIMYCDDAAVEAEKALKICYKIQHNYDEKQRKELLNFAFELHNNKIHFTAANFFEINRKTFFAVLSTTATYIIIVIQFVYE